MKKSGKGKKGTIPENQEMKNPKKGFIGNLNFKEYFKLRWKYLLGGYIFGYILTLVYYYNYNKFIDIKGYFPLKVMGLFSSLIFGNLVYYANEENDWFSQSGYFGKLKRLFKYILITVVIMIVFSEVDKLVYSRFNVSITWLMGFGF